MPGRRRRACWVLAGLVVFGAAGVVALRSIPADQLAERALSRLLDRRVEIGTVSVFARAGFEIEVQDLRVFAGAEAGPDEPPLFEAAAARGRQSWPRLFAGELMPLRWQLTAPVLRLAERDPGQAEPPPEPAAIPELDLTVVDGSVEWRPREGAPVTVRGLQLAVARAGLTRTPRGQAIGQIFIGDVLLAGVDVEFEGWLDELTLGGELDEFDLSLIPQQAVPLRGRATGRFELRREEGEIEVAVFSSVSGLRADIPGLDAPLTPERARLDARGRLSANQIALDIERLTLEDVDLDGRFALDRRPGGRIELDLNVAPFHPGPSERLHPVEVLARRITGFRGINDRIEAGRVYDVRIRLDTRLAELDDTLRWKRAPDPDEVEVRLRAEGGVYRTSGGALENISGALLIRGNTLHVQELHLESKGEPLPELDIRIDGVHRFFNLPEGERRTGPGPGVPLPGLGALARALGSGSGETESDEPESPLEIRFDELQLNHPSTLYPIRNAGGMLRWSQGALHVDDALAVVGGVPGQLGVVWDPSADRLQVRLHYLDVEAPPRVDPGDAWISGVLGIDPLRIGDWVVEGARGRLRIEGANVALSELAGTLAGGTVQGTGRLDLSSADALPYRFDLEIGDAAATGIGPRVGLGDSVTGSVAATGYLTGMMGSDRRFLDHAEVDFDIELRDGEVSGLPTLMAIARLPSLSGLRALLGRPLVFDRVDLRAHLGGGQLALSELSLTGPELRALAEAQMQLREPGVPTDALITLLFLGTVDRVLGALPVVRNVILGSDRNLVAVTFRVQGPRDELSVRPLPPRALQTATDWATGVLGGGVKRLRNLIGLDRQAEPADEEATETAPTPEPTTDDEQAEPTPVPEPGANAP